ncbi:MAG: DUF6599 family protein [Vicinamibacterales bacterium]
MKPTCSPLAARLVVAASLLAAFLVAACGGGSETGGPAPLASEAPPTGPAPASEVAALLPSGKSLAGWSRKVYGPGNLWEFIDGAAETYLAYGFQEAASAGYRSVSGLEVTLDVFRMADAVNAFGIFRQEMNPTAKPVPVGTEGCTGTNVLNFWKGRDYVKVTALGTADSMLAEMRGLADHVAASIPDREDLPSEVAFFPPANQVAQSVKYVPKDFVGQSYLERVFEAEYRDGQATVKLATASFDSPDDAREALARYRAFIASSGKVRSDIGKPGDGGFVGDENYYGRVAAVRGASRLVFVFGASSDAAGITLMDEFLARVNQRRD